MLVIIGLGNPGEKYKHSRHNTGWRVVDALASVQSPENSFKFEKSLEAETLLLQNALLVKPQTFMNLSGNAAAKVLKKYDYAGFSKKDFHTVFVVYDDLDIQVGKYKLVFGSGPKVHNGINHIKEVLGTDQFWHIRIGVDGRQGDRSVDPQDYVLSSFVPDEQSVLQSVVDDVVELLSESIENENGEK